MLVGGLLVAGMLHSALLAYRASRGAPSFAGHVRNPLNYSMTSADCLDWVQKSYRFAEVSGKGDQLSIVQADAGGGWPLPWYLMRKFPRYVWQGGDLSAMDGADVILSGLDFRSSLPEAVRGPEWVSFPLTLHPSGRLAVYVRRALWEAYVARAPWPELAIQR